MSKRTGNPNGPITPWKARATETRRKDAEERQKLYDALTPEQKIASLDKRGLNAKRERNRILNRL